MMQIIQKRVQHNLGQRFAQLETRARALPYKERTILLGQLEKARKIKLELTLNTCPGPASPADSTPEVDTQKYIQAAKIKVDGVAGALFQDANGILYDEKFQIVARATEDGVEWYQ